MSAGLTLGLVEVVRGRQLGASSAAQTQALALAVLAGSTPVGIVLASTVIQRSLAVRQPVRQSTEDQVKPVLLVGPVTPSSPSTGSTQPPSTSTTSAAGASPSRVQAELDIALERAEEATIAATAARKTADQATQAAERAARAAKLADDKAEKALQASSQSDRETPRKS